MLSSKEFYFVVLYQTFFLYLYPYVQAHVWLYDILLCIFDNLTTYRLWKDKHQKRVYTERFEA